MRSWKDTITREWLGIVWVMALVAGFLPLLRYSAGTGEPAMQIDRWPANSTLPQPTMPTLLVFAHPECPCSRATLGELEELMPAAIHKLAVTVVFVNPFPGKSMKGRLWQLAGEIPGVERLVDESGALAQAFGAHTSGQTLLFNAAGERVFQGGITPARGHRGDSTGQESVRAFLRDGQVTARTSAVFGCSLRKRALASEAGK